MGLARVLCWTLALCTLVTWLTPSPAAAQPRLDLLSSWGGPVADFQRVGNVGYAAVGQRLVILDMTDETNVQELSSVLMTGRAESVAVRGDYAYVGGYFNKGRLVAVDISNPSSPVVVWREFVANNPPVSLSVQHLCLYNNLLFVHNRDNGTDAVAYDVTNPAAPAAVLNGTSYAVRFRDSATGAIYFPRDFQIVGDLAYIATRRDRTTIAIFNMQPDPMHPTYVGSLTNTSSEPATGHRIAVEGNKAVVQVAANQGYVVRFVDVSNPASPVLANANNDFAFARDVAVQGNLAFVADWPGGIGTRPSGPEWSRLKGLAIFDITDLANPVLLGTYNTAHSSIREVQVVGNRAYAMCDGQGLVVLDISNPANPTRIGGYYSPGQLRQMTKVGNLLYVADAWNGFTVLNVSNPNVTPPVVGVYRGTGGVTNQQHRQVAVRDNLAYLAAGNGGIQIVDVSNPAAPTMVFHYPTNYRDLMTGELISGDGHVNGVELVGDVLHTSQDEFEPRYCTSGIPVPPTFYIYDISNPLTVAPILGSHGCPPTFELDRLTTKGGVTFSGRMGGGAISYRFDTSISTGPIGVTEESTWGAADVESHGNYLYIANDRSDIPGLSIVDVTDPYQPLRVGFWSYPSSGSTPRAVGVSGNRAFVGNALGIYVLDISNPAAPSEMLRTTDGWASDVIAEDDLCYSTYYGTAPQNAAGALLIRRLVEPVTCCHGATCLTVPSDSCTGPNAIVVPSCSACCFADYNHTGGVSVQDIFDFLGAYFEGSPYANVGGDGIETPTVQDIFDFLAAYFTGCP